MRNQNIASLVWANDMPYSCAQRLGVNEIRRPFSR